MPDDPRRCGAWYGPRSITPDTRCEARATYRLTDPVGELLAAEARYLCGTHALAWLPWALVGLTPAANRHLVVRARKIADEDGVSDA